MSIGEIFKLLWDLLMLLTMDGGSIYDPSLGSGAGEAAIGAGLRNVSPPLQPYVDELPRIPKLNGYAWDRGSGSYQPGVLNIGMFQKKWKFHRDLPATTVFAYGTSAKTASVPGPTIEAIQGIPTYVTWYNQLPDKHILPWDPTIPTAIPKNGGVPTVVHLHGGLQPPQSDGHADAWFTRGFNETGSTWSGTTYAYPNVHHAGNFWYHDHAVGLTRINLLAGLSGAYVIRDPVLEAKFNLPTESEFDRHLMLVDRIFNADGSIYMNCTGNNPTIHPQWQPEYYGDTITVNGKAWPYLRVQRRKYRFRIINASNARYFNLTLSNGLQFTVVASDASYLPSPVTAPNITLSPSEIADVIIDFSTTNATESFMDNVAPYPYPTGTTPDQYTGKVMKFIIQIGTPKFRDTSRIPSTLKSYSPATTAVANVTRYITLYEYQTPENRTTHLYINGLRFEDPVTETPKTGSTEVWEVINLTNDNHPLHLHLASIQATKVQWLVDLDTFSNCMYANYSATACNITGHATGPIIDIPAYEQTWKNSVKITPGCMTTVIAKFNMVDQNDAPYPFDATAAPGYLYHCHILDHEDNAMIRPLQLVP